MTSLIDDLISEVAAPRMPDAKAFKDSHRVEIPGHADQREVKGNIDHSKDVKKDRTRRADPAPGEDEESYKKLQGDDKSDAALDAHAVRVRGSAKVRKPLETTGGNNIEYAHHVPTGDLVEGAMAHGVMSKDKTKAAAARKALKALLAKPLPAKEASDKLYNLVFADDLFDDIGRVEAKNPMADVRDQVKNWLADNKIDLYEAASPHAVMLSEFTELPLPSRLIPAQASDEGEVRSGRYFAVASLRHVTSTAIGEMLAARRALLSLQASVANALGRTESGAVAVEAVDDIFASYTNLVSSLLSFEDEFASQAFVKKVRFELGLSEIDLDELDIDGDYDEESDET